MLISDPQEKFRAKHDFDWLKCLSWTCREGVLTIAHFGRMPLHLVIALLLLLLLNHFSRV